MCALRQSTHLEFLQARERTSLAQCRTPAFTVLYARRTIRIPRARHADPLLSRILALRLATRLNISWRIRAHHRDTDPRSVNLTFTLIRPVHMWSARGDRSDKPNQKSGLRADALCRNDRGAIFPLAMEEARVFEVSTVQDRSRPAEHCLTARCRTAAPQLVRGCVCPSSTMRVLCSAFVALVK